MEFNNDQELPIISTHYDSIEPWLPPPLPHRTLQRLPRAVSQRKKPIEERIREMYRKYSMDVMGEPPTPSRQIFREQLKKVEGQAQFQQLGTPRQQTQVECDLQTLRMHLRAHLYCCDSREVQLQVPKRSENLPKNSDHFQRMLRIKDRTRRRNSIQLRNRIPFQSEQDIPASNEQLGPKLVSPADRVRARASMRMRRQGETTVRGGLQIVGRESRRSEWSVRV